MASSMFALGMLLSTLALLLPSSMEKSIKPTPKPSKQIVAVCFLPKVEGLCTAYFPRFYFNQKTKKCEKFIYGGCGGNQNNFMTQQACLYKCAATTISSQLATGNKAANKTTVQQKTPKPIKQQAGNLNKPCEIDKKKALDNKYLFVPECDKNGDYKPKQCWKPPGVNTSCWCVDKKGSKIGEVKILPNGKETCNKTYTKPKQDSECFKLVKSYHENIPAENLAIMYIPQCDDYTGLYSPRQCHNNNCWCVNTLTGKLIKNSFGSKLTLKCPNA